VRLAGVRRAEDSLDAGGETGVGAEHGRMFGWSRGKCKRRKRDLGVVEILYCFS
jgi:hypothetical protein